MYVQKWVCDHCHTEGPETNDRTDLIPNGWTAISCRLVDAPAENLFEDLGLVCDNPECLSLFLFALNHGKRWGYLRMITYGPDARVRKWGAGYA